MARIRIHQNRPGFPFPVPTIARVFTTFAWWYPFDQPNQKKTPHFLHQSYPSYGTPFAIPVKISSIISWWYPFDVPIYNNFRVHYAKQQTELYTNRFYWQGTVRVMILGGGR